MSYRLKLNLHYGSVLVVIIESVHRPVKTPKGKNQIIQNINVK